MIININAEDDSGIDHMNYETKDYRNAFRAHRLIRPDSRDNITSQNSDLQNQNSIPSDNDSGIYTSPNVQNDQRPSFNNERNRARTESQENSRLALSDEYVMAEQNVLEPSTGQRLRNFFSSLFFCFNSCRNRS